MNDEIIGGMRNALERVETIEQAIQTFLNAGYSPNEVREAAGRVAPSAAAALYGQSPNVLSSSPSSAQTPPQTKTTSPYQPASSPPAKVPSQSPISSKPSSSPAAQPLPTLIPPQPPQSKKTVIILVVVLLILLILLGATLLFSDKILGFFSG